MYLPTTYSISLLLMLFTMIAWGSWANMAKIDKKWPFELFYWDFSFGVLATGLFFALTLGTFGKIAPSFFENISSLTVSTSLRLLASGALFNLANILLVAAISLAGIAVAFPVGIGIALVFGTLLNYFIEPSAHFVFLFSGVFFILLAISFDATAYKLSLSSVKSDKKGLYLAMIGGILMSFFYPLIADAMQEKEHVTAATPYSAIFFFSIGLFVSNFVMNPIFMAVSPVKPSYKEYFHASFLKHLWGFLGGFIWCSGTTMNILASTQTSPAIAYAFGQGATLVAALWGVFIWKEFKKTRAVSLLIVLMFLFYCTGLLLIGFSK